MIKSVNSMIMFSIILCGISCNTSHSSKLDKKNSPSHKTLLIKGHKEICVMEDFVLCLMSRSTENDTWDYHYGHISGFDYEWGYDYKILVKDVKEGDKIVMDEAGGTLKLLDILLKSKSSSDDNFEIDLIADGNSFIRKKNDVLLLLDEVSISMSEDLRTQFHEMENGQIDCKGQFKFTDNSNRIELVSLTNN